MRNPSAASDSEIFAELSARHRVWLCDVWGVLHDGQTAFKTATRRLRDHKRNGGKVALLTNAPRPARLVERQLKDIGIANDCYDALVTSGEVAADLIAARPPGRMLTIAPSWAAGIDGGENHVAAETPEDADFAVCIGPEDDSADSAENYVPYLRRILSRRLPLYCANPDLAAPRGGVRALCAGSIAHLYRDMGGETLMCGKPDDEIYRRALERLNAEDDDPSEILAVGDGIDTDMRGAAQRGFAAAFVFGGLHRHEAARARDDETAEQFFRRRLKETLPSLRLEATAERLE